MKEHHLNTLTYEVKESVLIITISREKVLNALNAEMHQELAVLFDDARDDNGVRAVIITGSGDRAFIAGADIGEMAQYGLVEARRYACYGNRNFSAMASFPKPTIAAINGFAFGGGLELAMAMDIRIASENAVMGQLEINLGIIPGGGGTQRLPRLVGSGIAREMVFTGMRIDARRAYEIGLVNHVVPHEQLMDKSMEIARSITSKSGIALEFAKRAIEMGLDMDLENGIKTEIELFSSCFATHDGIEGLKAFTEKRKPDFQNR